MPGSATNNGIHVVTGAFGYSGRYIARRLLARGVRVRTLTNSPRRGDRAVDVDVYPLDFERETALDEALRDARTLYNTYWVRFDHRSFDHETAVRHTLRLFKSAKRCGVERIVHVSITNPSLDSDLPYFRGKAELEEALKGNGVSYAILRPTVLFGLEDILINNIAWMLRRCPVFGVFGDGSYRLQPMFVDDLAQLAVEQGAGKEDCVIDAVGPETFTYRELVTRIGHLIGCPRPIISVPPQVGYALGWIVGKLMRDVVITREEIRGLMEGRLCTDSPPAGLTKLTDWVAAHADRLGVAYASELARRSL